MGEGGRLEQIQILRGVAASLVFIFHLVVIADLYTPAALRHWVEFGQIGVDLFFVISGFVMSYSVRDLRGPDEAAIFLSRRLWRIAPLLYFVTIVQLLLILADRDPLGMPQLVNGFTILPVLEGSSPFDTYAVVPAWTLGYELAFYLLVALIVAIRTRWRLTILAGMVLTLPLLPLSWPSALSPFGNYLMFEFAFGVAAYGLWSRNLITPRLALAAGLAGLLLLALPLAGGGIGLSQNPIGAPRVLLWGIPSGLLLVALLRWKPGTGGLTRLGSWLGAVSYSMYLIHTVAFDAIAPVFVSKFPLPIAMIGMAVVGIVATWWVHRVVESPLLAMRFYRRPTRAITI